MFFSGWPFITFSSYSQYGHFHFTYFLVFKGACLFKADLTLNLSYLLVTWFKELDSSQKMRGGHVRSLWKKCIIIIT